LALLGVGPESEAESVRFHERRVTKVGPEVNIAAGELWPLYKGVRGALGRCRTFRVAEYPVTGSVFWLTGDWIRILRELVASFPT
jgi:hypothetical protein